LKRQVSEISLIDLFLDPFAPFFSLRGGNLLEALGPAEAIQVVIVDPYAIVAFFSHPFSETHKKVLKMLLSGFNPSTIRKFL